MDIVTQDGSNADLAGPIAAGLRSVGVSPAHPLVPRDSDVALVPASAQAAFLLACEIEALEAMLGRLHALIDLMVGGGAGNSYSLSQAAKSISATLARLRAQFQQWYETGAGRTEVAAIDSDYHHADRDLLDGRYSPWWW
jgi:hypothetical protein